MASSFRTQIIAALAGLLALGALFFAAGRGEQGGAVPVPGGTFVEGLAGEPRFVNPLLASTQADRDAAALIFAGLTRLDERGETALDLAAGWNVSSDGLGYTFRFRPDIRWHDGVVVTADDVLFTVGLIQHPDFDGDPALSSLWRAVKVEKVDLSTVRFVLPAPYAAFVTYTRLGLLPAHLWRNVPPGRLRDSQLNLAPVGAGPFRLLTAAGAGGTSPASAPTPPLPPDGLLLERNPFYHREAPLLERIWLRYYPSSGVLAAALLRGEIDGAGGIDPAGLDQLRAAAGMRFFHAELAATEMIFLNTRLPLFDRREARRALLLGLDRRALLDAIGGGQGRIADGPILPSSWAYDRDLPEAAYDPAEARRLLDQAGWLADGSGGRMRGGTSLSFTIATAQGDAVAQALGRAAVEQWRRIGVQARLRSVARDQLLDELLAQRNFEAVLIGWRAPTNDPDVYQLWHSTQASPGGGLNFSGYSSTTADQALEQGRLIVARQERALHYSRFQRAFTEDVPSLLLYYPLYSYVAASHVRGVTLPAALLDPSGRFRFVSSWYVRTR